MKMITENVSMTLLYTSTISVNGNSIYPADEGMKIYPAIMCYINYMILLFFGHLRDILDSLVFVQLDAKPLKKGLAPLLATWENFYRKRIYHRIQDVFNFPVASSPGAYIDIYERYSTNENKSLVMDQNKPPRRCLNLASYNYLGFADDWMSTCSDAVFAAVDQFSLASSSATMEFGSSPLHQQLEQVVAEFLSKEDAVVFNMGYGTNATGIPAMMGKGTLIISDSLNHSSIVNGARGSNAVVRVFQHNDAEHLEKVLRREIAYGQPRTHRPWKKIIVIIEGIYSMEGECVNLRPIVDICKKYKAYTYIDEAHSIGALGRTGRGICEHANVDPSEVDILMGTFTKSFGGVGGYIVGSKELCTAIRKSSAGIMYGNSLSPVVVKQVLHVFRILQGQDGTKLGQQKIQALRENSNFMRKKLREMGLVTLGEYDSPVIPIMLYSSAKMPKFSKECKQRNLAIVVVGFPATPLLLARIRICVSAAHRRKDLEEALVKLEEVCDICHIKFQRTLLG